MKTILLSLLALVPLLAGAEPPNKATKEAAIWEATFRYQFNHNPASELKGLENYYLSIPGKNGEWSDPPADFMKRFASNKPPVKMVSECNASTKGVVDKVTGERGLIFHTDAIKWISDTEVEVSGGYYMNGLGASGNTYYLKKVNGKWKVTKDVMHFVS